MVDSASLAALPRTRNGKGPARSLRRAGKIPAVIYGRGRAPESLEIDGLALERLLARIRGTTLVDVEVEDRQPVKVLIREIQRDPLRPASILHLDLYEVHADEEISLEVPLAFLGTPDGVRNGGGVFEVITHEITLRVLPGDIPERIEVDVAALGVGQSLHVSDLAVAKGEILTDGEVTICTVVAPRTEEAAAPVEGAPAAETVEPELIRKPKPADEEDTEKE